MKGKILSAIFTVLSFFFSCFGSGIESAGNFCCVINGADIGKIIASDYEVAIIDYSRDGSRECKYSSREIGEMKNSGILPVCYLSIGEAEDYRFYWKEEWKIIPPSWLGTENPHWKGNYKARYWEADWHEIIGEYLSEIISQGFSGVFLDTVDSYYHWSVLKKELPVEEAARRMLQLIKLIHDTALSKVSGEFDIIIQNAEDILEYAPEILKYIDGISVEELLFSAGKENSPEEIEYRIGYLKEFRKNGKTVMLIEYISDSHGNPDEKKLKYLSSFCRENGFLYYAAGKDRKLDELIPRKID